MNMPILVGTILGFSAQRFPARVVTRAFVVMALVGIPFGASGLASAGQAPAATDPLAALAPLVGRWAGTTEGQPGKGTVERQYERVLGRFVQVRNKSTYPPQDKNPKGEVHEDMGLFGFDRARKLVIFRQFHSEGFVTQYAMAQPSAPGRLVFTTEAIENIPAGWRARETYVLTGDDQFEEIFELAEPGKEFELYSRNRLTRVR
jgi:hypothetical protein